MPITLRVEGAEEMKRKLAATPRIIVAARRSAVNKLGAQGLTQAKRRIREVYNIKSKDLNPYVKLIRARGSTTYAVLEASGRPIPLIKFDARPISPPSQKGIKVASRKAVTVRVKRGQPRKRVRNAFVARMRSGHIGIFTRVGRRTLPIRERYSLGVQKMFEKESIPAVRSLLREKGGKIVAHELEWQIEREFKKRGLSI